MRRGSPQGVLPAPCRCGPRAVQALGPACLGRWGLTYATRLPTGRAPRPLPLWPHRPMPSFQIQPGCPVSKSSSTGFRIQRLIPSFQIQPGGPVTKSRQLPNPGRFPNPSRSFRIQGRLPNPGPSCRSPVAESIVAPYLTPSVCEDGEPCFPKQRLR